jgi:hypothetical protein
MKSVIRILMLQPAAAITCAPALAAPRRIDQRAFHMGMLLLMLAILNAVDLAYTLFAHRIGMLEEMNPLADSFLSQGLEHILISYKMLMVLAGSTMLWRVRRSGWAVPACWLLIVAYTGLALLWYLWVRDILHVLNTPFITLH